jgi:hypothetical protein
MRAQMSRSRQHHAFYHSLILDVLSLREIVLWSSLSKMSGCTLDPYQVITATARAVSSGVLRIVALYTDLEEGMLHE